MKQLSIELKIVFFFMSLNVCVVLGMELPPRNRIIPSLRSLCIQCQARDAQKTGEISNLMYWPTDCAIDVIVSMGSNWRALDENRIKLIEFAQWRMDVMCALVEKINDIRLACGLAKQGKVTSGVAAVLVHAFLTTDITTALNAFNGLFIKSFPESILGYGNYSMVYKILVNAMTGRYWFEMKNTENKHNFSKDDFYMDLPLEKVGRYIKPPGHKNQLEYATVDIERNFLVASYAPHHVSMHHLKTGIMLGVATAPIKVAKLVLKQDNGAWVIGILDVNDKINDVEIPMTLLQAEIPLQQIAALVYCKVQIYKKTIKTSMCMGYAIFESEDCDEELALIRFMQETLQEDWVPSCIKDSLLIDEEYLKEVAVLRAMFAHMAGLLGVTRKQVAIDLFVNNKHMVWSTLREQYLSLSGIETLRLQIFGKIFKSMYGYK